MSAPTDPNRDHRFAFLRGFLKRPKEVGSIIPSSRFMEKRIVRTADLSKVDCVVELGPGTGGTTRALLRQMKLDAKLLAIELNPDFAELIETNVDDARLIVHHGSAAAIPEALDRYDLGNPEVILSGIPFSTMSQEMALSILRSVHDSLAPGGRFVAYQVRDRVETLGREVFGRAHVQTEVLNIPPMRVYSWDKTIPHSLREPALA
jgi:phospholipid N-methyltransferase